MDAAQPFGEMLLPPGQESRTSAVVHGCLPALVLSLFNLIALTSCVLLNRCAEYRRGLRDVRLAMQRHPRGIRVAAEATVLPLQSCRGINHA